MAGPSVARPDVAESFDLEWDDIHDVRITLRALDSFRFHHGGTEQAARVQLEAMLEDFARLARRRATETAKTLLHQGYRLNLSPDLSALTGYSTNHRERTWEQVKSGIRSRVSKKTRADAEWIAWREALVAGDPVDTALPLSSSVDVDNVLLSPKALATWARRRPEVNTEDLEQDLRGALREALRNGSVDVPGGVIFVMHPPHRWTLTLDGTAVLGIARIRE